MSQAKPVGRRGFLALLAGTPFAAKEVANTSLAEAEAGIKTLGGSGVKYGDSAYGVARRKTHKAIVKLLLKGKEIPLYKRREWLSDARYHSRRLDGDLASMRSISVSNKIRIQTERNYEREKQAYIEELQADTAWTAFKNAVGLKPDDDDWYGE